MIGILGRCHTVGQTGFFRIRFFKQINMSEFHITSFLMIDLLTSLLTRADLITVFSGAQPKIQYVILIFPRTSSFKMDFKAVNYFRDKFEDVKPFCV